MDAAASAGEGAWREIVACLDVSVKKWTPLEGRVPMELRARSIDRALLLLALARGARTAGAWTTPLPEALCETVAQSFDSAIDTQLYEFPYRGAPIARILVLAPLAEELLARFVRVDSVGEHLGVIREMVERAHKVTRPRFELSTVVLQDADAMAALAEAGGSEERRAGIRAIAQLLDCPFVKTLEEPYLRVFESEFFTDVERLLLFGAFQKEEASWAPDSLAWVKSVEARRAHLRQKG